MKTVAKIIAQRGGLEGLKRKHIRIENPPYLPLVIEFVGNGPHGRTLVSVAHTYVQNGDLGYDPEMEFEIVADAKLGLLFSPVSYRQDNLGTRQQAVWVTDRQLQIDRRVFRDLEQFAKTWDKNLRAQGFLAAAKGGGVSR